MTLIFLLILLGVGGLFSVIGVRIGSQSRPGLILFLGIGSACLLSVPITAIFAPLGYAVGPRAVTVIRFASNVDVPLEDITEVEAVQLKGVIRVFGNGGAFGFWGTFSSKAFGTFQAYVTRSDNFVALKRRSGRPIVLSPDSPIDLVRAVQDALAGYRKEGQVE